MATSKQTYINRIFQDPKNYPYGFRRSGDFSIKESEALEKFGCVIDAIARGEILPADAEDEHIAAVLEGREPAATTAEVAWLKYIKRINRPKLGSLYGNKHKPTLDGVDDDEVLADDDIDDDLDTDD